MAELHKAYIEKEEDTFYRTCRFISALELFKTRSGLILDIGCNDAMFKDFLSSSIEYVGIDVSVPALREAKNKGAKVIYADALHLPFKQTTFDSVFCIEVIEHIPKTRNAILEIKRVLKKRGSLIISVPNLVNLLNRMLILMGRASESILIENHFHQYTPRSFDDFLQTCGFKVVNKGRLVAHPLSNKTFGRIVSILLPKNMHAIILRRAVKS